jgi:DNA repair exonuclease SbcCD nuclease subunit
MRNFSFVHCADLHLGCQQFNLDERWEDFGQAFGQIVDYAIEHQADYLLIAGDLFHHRSISAPTLSQAIHYLAKLKKAGVKVVAIEGNHDKAFYLEKDSWMSFLHNQGYFVLLKPTLGPEGLELNSYDGEKGAILHVPGVRFIGLGYLGATTKQRLEELNKVLASTQDYTIVLLHAGVDKLLGQDLAGVKGEVFEGFADKVDYFALGHIHSRQELGELCYNPGAPECVHLDEEKKGHEKGFYHVKVQGKEKEVKFVPSLRRPVYRYRLDLEGLERPEQVTRKVLDFLQLQTWEDVKRPIIQLNLTGTVHFSSYAIDVKGLEEEIKNTFDCLAVEILNNTNIPALDQDRETLSFDRNTIEKHVLREMIEFEKPEFKPYLAEIVDLVLQVKQDVLTGVEEASILELLEKMVEKLPEDEDGQKEGEASEA